jgi:hypothetical protein
MGSWQKYNKQEPFGYLFLIYPYPCVMLYLPVSTDTLEGHEPPSPSKEMNKQEMLIEGVRQT